MIPSECARRVIAGADESIIAKMKSVFRDGSDDQKVKFAQPFIETELNKSWKQSSPDKCNIRSVRLLNKSEESLRKNKYHLALETLNKALAYAKETEIIKKIESQRELVLEKSRLSSEIKLKTDDSVKEKESSDCFMRTSELPKLFMGKNKEIKEFCAAVELQCNEDQGRHLIAMHQIPPGCVIGVELPFASVLHSSCKYTHCSQCLTKAHFLIPCQNCTQAMYCSESCRASAWSEHHSVECQIAGQLQTAGLSPVDVLAVRVLSLSKPDEILRCQPGGKRNSRCAGFNTDGTFDSNSLQAFVHTHCNPQDWTFEETLGKLVTALVILRICGLDKHPHSIQLAAFLLRSLRSIPLNSHEIAERCNCNGRKLSDHGIALGMFTAFSLVNHSCDQNVAKQNIGRHSIMRSISLIKKGDQIVDSYGPHFIADPFQARVKILNDQFRFKCNCEACDKNWPTQRKLPWSLQFEIGDEVREIVRSYLENGRVRRDWVEVLEGAVEMIDKQGKRMCQLYFVLQQMLKIHYASSSFVVCRLNDD